MVLVVVLVAVVLVIVVLMMLVHKRRVMRKPVDDIVKNKCNLTPNFYSFLGINLHLLS